MKGGLTRFQEGHSASRKYTPEKAIEIFQQILNYIKENQDVYLLVQALNAFDYYPMLINYLMRAFPDTHELKEIYMQIMSQLEERITLGGLNGRLKETMSIFILKTSHGKVEKAPQQDTTPTRQGVDWSKVPVEKMEEIRRILLEAQNKDEESGNQGTQGWVEAETE